MKDNNIINIAIADQFAIYRNGLKNIINSMDGFKLVFDVSSGAELIEKLTNADTLPDICIMDLSKNENEYYDVIKQVRSKWIGLKILALSEFSTEFRVIRMINLGVNGFLPKGCEPEDIKTALYNLYDKGYYYSLAIPEIVFRKAKASVLMKITMREMEFLMLCCTDFGYKNIADIMGISVRTIESYRDSLYDKLHVKSRMGLMIFALKAGIIPADKLQHSMSTV